VSALHCLVVAAAESQFCTVPLLEVTVDPPGSDLPPVVWRTAGSVA
jgi:hypothetical protein